MSRKKVLQDAVFVIRNRKSVRDYTGQVIDRETLHTILRAGMAAPTAVNMQPWSFIAVTDREILMELCEALPYAKMLDRAGAAVVVCAIRGKAYEKRFEFAVIDCTCASENILLAAEALGLGAVWTAAYPYDDRMEVVRKILNIPEEVTPLNVIAVGYPAGENKPVDKYSPGNIHWERW